jgi:hypothetical protein
MIHEITVQVPEAQLAFFQQLMQQLKFKAKMPKLKKKPATYEELNPAQKRFVDDMTVALEEVRAIERGEIEPVLLDAFLDELDRENAPKKVSKKLELVENE